MVQPLALMKFNSSIFILIFEKYPEIHQLHASIFALNKNEVRGISFDFQIAALLLLIPKLSYTVWQKTCEI